MGLINRSCVLPPLSSTRTWYIIGTYCCVLSVMQSFRVSTLFPVILSFRLSVCLATYCSTTERERVSVDRERE
jgi:hypothetical protein